eukprot:UN28520
MEKFYDIFLRLALQNDSGNILISVANEILDFGYIINIAELLLETHLSTFSKSDATLYLQSKIYLAQENYDESLNILQQIKQLNSDGHLMAGNCYMKLLCHNAAYESYRAYLSSIKGTKESFIKLDESDPRGVLNAFGVINFGKMQYKNKDYENGIQTFLQFLEFRPSYKQIHGCGII